jgi:hypothetical protein
MVKSGFARCIFPIIALMTLAAQNQPSAGKSSPVILKYLGAAGWEISDGTTSILIDPYLSRINGPAPQGAIPWLTTLAGLMGGVTLRPRT